MAFWADACRGPLSTVAASVGEWILRLVREPIDATVFQCNRTSFPSRS